ncbi:hypothetical protein QBC38DRAFT_342109, partial [Podospora fimiseda]
LSSSSVFGVVIVAHSTGATRLKFVMDRLAQSEYRDILYKVELYTFGAFCSEFKNLLAHHDTQRTLISHIEHFARADDPLATMGVL